MIKINYNEQMESILAMGDCGKLLLHSCCAPCSSHCIDILRQYVDLAVFYYNPNIYPEQEYFKRKAEQKRLLLQAFEGIDLIDCDHDSDAFYAAAKGYESCPEGGERCAKCFYLRLKKTAQAAKAGGYNYFATTLTVSPHKNSALINEIGQAVAKEVGVKFLPSDFKKKEGYKHSLKLSEKYYLYRQNYCGCEFSLAQRDKFCNR